MRAELALLEARLNYAFSRPELLDRALTHSSAAHEAHAGPCSPDTDNEQLEFLGDSILGFLTSELLVARHPEFLAGRAETEVPALQFAANRVGVGRVGQHVGRAAGIGEHGAQLPGEAGVVSG